MTTPAEDALRRQLSVYGYGLPPFTKNHSWRSFRLTCLAVADITTHLVLLQSFLLDEMRQYLSSNPNSYFCDQAMICLIDQLMKTGDPSTVDSFAFLLRDHPMSTAWLKDPRLCTIVSMGLKEQSPSFMAVIKLILQVGCAPVTPMTVKDVALQDQTIHVLAYLFPNAQQVIVDNAFLQTDPFVLHLVQKLHYSGFKVIPTEHKASIKDRNFIHHRKDQLLSVLVHWSLFSPFVELGHTPQVLKPLFPKPNKWSDRVLSMSGSKAHPFEYLLRLAQVHPSDPSGFFSDEEEVLMATLSFPQNQLLKESSWKMFTVCQPKMLIENKLVYRSIMDPGSIMDPESDVVLRETDPLLHETIQCIFTSVLEAFPAKAQPPLLPRSLLKANDIYLEKTSILVVEAKNPYPKPSMKLEKKAVVYHGAPNNCQLNRCALNCVIECLYALPSSYRSQFPEKLQKIMEQRSLDQLRFGPRFKPGPTDSQQLLHKFIVEQKVALGPLGSHLPLILILEHVFHKTKPFQFDPQTKMEDLHVGVLAVQHPGTLQSVCEKAFRKGFQVPPVCRILFQPNNRGLKKTKSVPSFDGTGAQCVRMDSMHFPFVLNGVTVVPQSVIFGDGGHFTAQIKLNDGLWYAYNDLMDLGKMRCLGSTPVFDNGFWKQKNILYLIAIS